MNVTAYLMGDPAPGRSALERRFVVSRITLATRPANRREKLTAAKVAMIRSSDETSRALALRLGVSEPAIVDARSGRTWKHI